MVGNASRAAIISDRRITGLSVDVIAELVSEIGPLWNERHEARLTSRPRKRTVGAGAKHRLVFVDRLLAALVHLRHGVTHDVLACWFGVDRSTVTRAIGEVRPLLAERGYPVSPDVRLRSLADVVDHLGASGSTGIIDGTEIRVRRPAAGRKDRDKFISGKNKQNAVKTMIVTDGEGRVLWCSPARPASCADITHARQLGLVKLLADGPAVEILTDAGYQGLGAQTGGRVITPPHRKFKKNAPDWHEEVHERQRKAHSSRRIRVEHGIAHLKNWRSLARHLGRREHISDTVQAVASLLSHQQIGTWTRHRRREHRPQRSSRRLTAYRARARKGCPVNDHLTSTAGGLLSRQPGLTRPTLSTYVDEMGNQVLLACGMAAGPLFTVAYLLQGASRVGYRPFRHPVSSLASVVPGGYRPSTSSWRACCRWSSPWACGVLGLPAGVPC
ncbi:transposase family protein [Streptomyces anthocyanicus]|uniref:transposase family protein n=2 Tax=Streptomyces TaxID=1883 RepID=UPI003652903B